jgi:mannosyltransferase
MADGRNIVDPAAIEVIAPNFKRRLSGVTSTIIQLVPALDAAGCRIAVLGPGLPAHLPHIRIRDLWRLWRRPGNGRRRVWHARRNVEMLGGVVLRDILRMPLALLFTSASQRHHKRWTKFRHIDEPQDRRLYGAAVDRHHAWHRHGTLPSGGRPA